MGSFGGIMAAMMIVKVSEWPNVERDGLLTVEWVRHIVVLHVSQ